MNLLRNIAVAAVFTALLLPAAVIIMAAFGAVTGAFAGVKVYVDALLKEWYE